jgi:hypothetical protein
MDAHRLRLVIDRILEEHNRLGIEKKLGEVPKALAACVKSPSASADEHFRDMLDMLTAACGNSRTVDFVESERRILERLNARPFVGAGLTAQIQAIVDERPFMPARAKEQFARLAEEVQAYMGTLSTTQASLRRLNVEPPEPGRDDYELGILLPDSFVKGHLSRVAQELQDWDQFLEEFLPLVTGKTAEVRLRTHSAGMFELIVGLDQGGALALGTILGELYGIFAMVRSNRGRLDELKQQKYPKEILGTLQSYEQQIIHQGLAALREMVLAKFVRVEGGRRKDLDRVLERGLRFLVVRVNDGVSLEISGPLPFDDAEREGPVVAWADERLHQLPHQVRAAVAMASGAPKAPPGPERSEHMQIAQITDDKVTTEEDADEKDKPSRAA